MPALPSFFIEPLWCQFEALILSGQGHHRPRITDRVDIGKLIQVLVFGPPTRRSATPDALPP